MHNIPQFIDRIPFFSSLGVFGSVLDAIRSNILSPRGGGDAGAGLPPGEGQMAADDAAIMDTEQQYGQQQYP